MTVAYWLVAASLAVFYLYSGAMKMIRAKDRLRPMMGWVDDMPLAAVRGIGVLEVLGALGLVLPPLAGIALVLPLLAAIGLALIQVGGIVVHVRRDETKVIGLNIFLLALACVGAWLATVWL